MAAKPKNKKVFTDEMAHKLIELGKSGASQKSMFAALDISASLAGKWRKENPYFEETMSMAVTHAQAYWENMMLANVDNKNFNSRIVEIALRGQFPVDYRETRDNKVDVKVDATIDFNSAINDLIKQLKKAE